MAKPKRSARSTSSSPLRRLLLAAAALGVVVFAVQGGEYSTLDLLRQRARGARVRAEIDSLRRIVDSLRQYRQGVERDPALQEQLAREEFGLVRGDHELLYRFAEPSAADSAAARARGGTKP